MGPITGAIIAGQAQQTTRKAYDDYEKKSAEVATNILRFPNEAGKLATGFIDSYYGGNLLNTLPKFAHYAETNTAESLNSAKKLEVTVKTAANEKQKSAVESYKNEMKANDWINLGLNL